MRHRVPSVPPRRGRRQHSLCRDRLRRFNDDVREVASGYECGIVLKDFADVKEGDVLEAYTTRKVERELA